MLAGTNERMYVAPQCCVLVCDCHAHVIMWLQQQNAGKNDLHIDPARPVLVFKASGTTSMLARQSAEGVASTFG